MRPWLQAPHEKRSRSRWLTATRHRRPEVGAPMTEVVVDVDDWHVRGACTLQQSLDPGQCLHRNSEQAIRFRKVEIIDDVDKEQRNGVRRRLRASDGHDGNISNWGSGPIVAWSDAIASGRQAWIPAIPAWNLYAMPVSPPNVSSWIGGGEAP